jgi:anti-anti-sigma factor
MEQPEMPPVESPQVLVLLANNPTQDTVVWLTGEHDLSTVEELAATIAAAADTGRPGLILDLSHVEFMDSSTIAQILVAPTSLGAEGRTVRVRDPSPLARYLLEICGLTELVDLTSTGPRRERRSPTAPDVGSEPPTLPRHPPPLGLAP